MAGTNPFLQITSQATPKPPPTGAAPAPAPSAPAPAPTSSNPFLAITRGAQNAPKAIDNSLGKGIVAGEKNPFRQFTNFIGTPQRALEAVETGRNPWEAVTHPEEADELSKAVKTKIGLQQQEDTGALSGTDLPHKLLRGAVDTGLDIANDPLTFAPIGKAAEAIGKAVPEIGKLGRSFVRAYEDSPVGRFTNPEEPILGYGLRDRAVIQSAHQGALTHLRRTLEAKNNVIKQNAGAIRSGQIPPAVAQLFVDQKNVPAAVTGMRPQEVVRALHDDHNKFYRKDFIDRLDRAGFDVQKGGADEELRSFGVVKPTENPILKATQAATHLGNQMFLANPIPHGGNLANLSYMRYGLLRTLAGLGDALRVSSGKLTPELQRRINTLEKYGANSQYQKIFDELGLTKLAGSQKLAGAANKVLIPAQRASNYAQAKFLNPLETGLRASALRAEEKGGKTGAEAARQIHTAFGSDDPNAISRASADIGTPFAKFHGQTVVGQGLRTLATNPARVGNVVKADQDFNKEVNPSGPQYRSSIPSMSTARALAAPARYFPTLLGPLESLGNDYSSLTMLQKGKVAEALTVVLNRYIPVDQVVETIRELTSGSKGTEGESGVQDIIPSVIGGYYGKPQSGQ